MAVRKKLRKPPGDLDRGVWLEKPDAFIQWGAMPGVLRRIGRPRTSNTSLWWSKIASFDPFSYDLNHIGPVGGTYLWWEKVACLGGIPCHFIAASSSRGQGVRVLHLLPRQNMPEIEVVPALDRWLTKILGEPSSRRKNNAREVISEWRFPTVRVSIVECHAMWDALFCMIRIASGRAPSRSGGSRKRSNAKKR